MSKYILSKRSLTALEGVDPRLVDVVKRAIQITKQDFLVTEGLRTRERMMEIYGQGRTVAQLAVKGIPAKYAKPKASKVTWLNDPYNSLHGRGRAVDLAPYPVDYNTLSKFDKIADAMFASAKELGVKIRWGADWDGDGKIREAGEYDATHFELV